MHLRLVSLQNWFFRIDKYMENENSVNALFVEPNAYIQKCDNVCDSTKKVVFQQPYESMPNFYLNNDFKKRNCDCVSGKKKPCQPHECCDKPQNKDCCVTNGFNLQKLLPLLGMFGGGSNFDVSKITSILGGMNGGIGQSDFMSTISSIMSNKDLMANLLKSFTGSKLNSSKSNKEHIKSTDFEIKNYTRVN